MGAADSTRPDEFISRETGLPLDLNLEKEGWHIITPQGARQRGWGAPERVEPVKLEQWIMEAMTRRPDTPVAEVQRELQTEHGDIPERDLLEAMNRLLQKNRLMAYRSPPTASEEAPAELIYGADALYQQVQPKYYVITPSEAAVRGWVKDDPRDRRLILEGNAFTERLVGLLPRLAELFARGGKTQVDLLELTDLKLKGGGRLRLVLEDIPPDSMRRLDELFQTLAVCAQRDFDTHATVEVEEPDPSCPFLSAVNPNEN
jgi:hypothetical protein